MPEAVPTKPTTNPARVNAPSRGGRPLASARVSVAERFWSKVELIPFHECWEWNGRMKGGKGYGGAVVGVASSAHRAAWILTYGPIENRLCVLHRCDNPSCVRPDHLFLGTAADNTADMMRKGRDGNRKIPRCDLAAIRARYAAGEPGTRLAREYGVTRQCISLIVNGKTWTERAH